MADTGVGGRRWHGRRRRIERIAEVLGQGPVAAALGPMQVAHQPREARRRPDIGCAPGGGGQDPAFLAHMDRGLMQKGAEACAWKPIGEEPLQRRMRDAGLNGFPVLGAHIPDPRHAARPTPTRFGFSTKNRVIRVKSR